MWVQSLRVPVWCPHCWCTRINQVLKRISLPWLWFVNESCLWWDLLAVDALQSLWAVKQSTPDLDTNLAGWNSCQIYPCWHNLNSFHPKSAVPWRQYKLQRHTWLRWLRYWPASRSCFCIFFHFFFSFFFFILFLCLEDSHHQALGSLNPTVQVSCLFSVWLFVWWMELENMRDSQQCIHRRHFATRDRKHHLIDYLVSISPSPNSLVVACRWREVRIA